MLLRIVNSSLKKIFHQLDSLKKLYLLPDHSQKTMAIKLCVERDFWNFSKYGRIVLWLNNMP